MIVVEFVATGTLACGRAAPTLRTSSPSTSSAAGIRRCHRVRPGSAILTSAIEVTRTAAFLRRRRIHHEMASTSGTISAASRAHGQVNVIRPASRYAPR